MCGSCSTSVGDKDYAWLYERMLLLVECIGFDLCGRCVYFRTERCFVYYFLFFVSRTSLVIRRMISTTEDTSDMTVSFFSVALVCQVVTCALDAYNLLCCARNDRGLIV
jgi:hypothetical protein